MTNIRIYEDHNKVVIEAESKNMYDKLFEVLELSSCEREWKDEDWTFVRLPLDEFMYWLRKSAFTDAKEEGDIE